MRMSGRRLLAVATVAIAAAAVLASGAISRAASALLAHTVAEVREGHVRVKRWVG